jgi:hypothetical protein
MTDSYIRLTYASTANFLSNKGGGIESEVARILMQSRGNNSRVDVGGVLHFGNGYFFQCLEGPKDQVNDIFSRIGKDNRHKAVQILSSKVVNERLFDKWSMKYLQLERSLTAVLVDMGQKNFNPYQLDDSMIDNLLNACIELNDASADTSPTEEKRPSHPLVLWWKRKWSASQ